ncbi:hypothetical protein NEOLEDRAFT_1142124 [Neolentinus lepideus HHB14362 ss-1]|uniref:Uncharacterized protein n=1 Tax=Neolentinus lepideus HHB14362 ss-1 TaxID=1314782 RepID=A0A165NBY0_9AGAM|nr:hypothetical protein NEOLEDRAFT_1142124 [Neolentinus lepideus HHB14362 ss-1]
MTEYATTPSELEAYKESLNRTNDWVIAHSPTNSLSHFSDPHVPPSRTPTLAPLSGFLDEGEGEGEGDGEESKRKSVPPRMFLRYKDGRPDLPIEMYSESLAQHSPVPGPAPASRHPSQASQRVPSERTVRDPPRPRVTESLEYAPSRHSQARSHHSALSQNGPAQVASHAPSRASSTGAGLLGSHVQTGQAPSRHSTTSPASHRSGAPSNTGSRTREVPMEDIPQELSGSAHDGVSLHSRHSRQSSGSSRASRHNSTSLMDASAQPIPSRMSAAGPSHQPSAGSQRSLHTHAAQAIPPPLARSQPSAIHLPTVAVSHHSQQAMDEVPAEIASRHSRQSSRHSNGSDISHHSQTREIPVAGGPPSSYSAREHRVAASHRSRISQQDPPPEAPSEHRPPSIHSIHSEHNHASHRPAIVYAPSPHHVPRYSPPAIVPASQYNGSQYIGAPQASVPGSRHGSAVSRSQSLGQPREVPEPVPVLPSHASQRDGVPGTSGSHYQSQHSRTTQQNYPRAISASASHPPQGQYYRDPNRATPQGSVAYAQPSGPVSNPAYQNQYHTVPRSNHRERGKLAMANPSVDGGGAVFIRDFGAAARSHSLSRYPNPMAVPRSGPVAEQPAPAASAQVPAPSPSFGPPQPDDGPHISQLADHAAEPQTRGMNSRARSGSVSRHSNHTSEPWSVVDVPTSMRSRTSSVSSASTYYVLASPGQKVRVIHVPYDNDKTINPSSTSSLRRRFFQRSASSTNASRTPTTNASRAATAAPAVSDADRTDQRRRLFFNRLFDVNWGARERSRKTEEPEKPEDAHTEKAEADGESRRSETSSRRRLLRRNNTSRA